MPRMPNAAMQRLTPDQIQMIRQAQAQAAARQRAQPVAPAVQPQMAPVAPMAPPARPPMPAQAAAAPPMGRPPFMPTRGGGVANRGLGQALRPAMPPQGMPPQGMPPQRPGVGMAAPAPAPGMVPNLPPRPRY